jgi:hypothetical protein
MRRITWGSVTNPMIRTGRRSAGTPRPGIPSGAVPATVAVAPQLASGSSAQATPAKNLVLTKARRKEVLS